MDSEWFRCGRRRSLRGLDGESTGSDKPGIETRRYSCPACIVWSVLALACATGPQPLPGELEPTKLSNFRIIAHRGGAAHAPENTLPAFRRSLANGFAEVELDVQLSLDEVLVLFHDHTLERKTGHEGSVGVYSAEELTGFELGSWFDREHPEVTEPFAGTRIATLSELFSEFASRLYYHLEIKGEDPRVPMFLLQAIEGAGLRGRVTVTSFSFDQLARFRSLAPEISVCWLLARRHWVDPKGAARQRARVEEARRAGFTGVAVHASRIDAQIVGFAHENDLEIRAWGIGSDIDEQRVIAAGSDGATTDWPERLRSRLSE